MEPYFISTDRSMLDHDFIVGALQSSYWAAGRPRDVIIAAIGRSLCFGVYEAKSRRQVGFARVVTDEATASWLCDVFVAPEHRSRGLGKRLVQEVVTHPRVASTKLYLATRDAHGLYEKFGFERFESMRRLPSSAEPL